VLVPAFNQGVLHLSGSGPAFPEVANTKLGQPLFDLALAQQNKLRSAIVQELYGEFTRIQSQQNASHIAMQYSNQRKMFSNHTMFSKQCFQLSNLRHHKALA